MQASKLICFCMILAMQLILKWATFHIRELYLEGVCRPDEAQGALAGRPEQQIYSLADHSGQSAEPALLFKGYFSPRVGHVLFVLISKCIAKMKAFISRMSLRGGICL